MHQPSKLKLRLVSKKRESPDTVTLVFENADGSDLPLHTPGQYVNIFLPDPLVPEGKSYSVSSAPDSKNLSLTVKIIGEFSNFLANLSVGDVVIASEPFGYFYSEEKVLDLVLLAGGIGITPFLSMLREMDRLGFTRDVWLFYSSRTIEDFVALEEIRGITRRNDKLHATYFLTGEEVTSDDFMLGRMNAKNIMAKLDNAVNSEFLICGTIGFTRDLWKQLREEKVAVNRIFTEAFFSH